jgi:hypothetical protein
VYEVDEETTEINECKTGNSKYINDFKPILPTFFKSPIELIPKTMVKKIIGPTNTFMIEIKPLPINSIFSPKEGLK